MEKIFSGFPPLITNRIITSACIHVHIYNSGIVLWNIFSKRCFEHCTRAPSALPLLSIEAHDYASQHTCRLVNTKKFGSN